MSICICVKAYRLPINSSQYTYVLPGEKFIYEYYHDDYIAIFFKKMAPPYIINQDNFKKYFVDIQQHRQNLINQLL